MQKIKRIITQEEIEKRNAKKKLIIGLILIVVMILSTAGYAFFGIERRLKERLDYNGFKFTMGEDGFWHTSLQNHEFIFSFNPKETENISNQITLNFQDYAGKPLYFSHDSDREGIAEITRNLERFVFKVGYACLGECEEDWPIKNCSENLIIIKSTEIDESLIKQEDSCVFILSDKGEVLRAVDAFMFKILRIQ